MPKKQRKYIKIRGANEHNLKAIDIDIPRDEFVVLTGLSGSGKSSVFLCKTIPWTDGKAKRGIDRRTPAGNIHRPEIDQP